MKQVDKELMLAHCVQLSYREEPLLRRSSQAVRMTAEYANAIRQRWFDVVMAAFRRIMLFLTLPVFYGSVTIV